MWVGDKVEIIEVDQNPFFAEVEMLVALFYSPLFRPITFSAAYEGVWKHVT